MFAVRKGNPKNIQTWDDVVKPGVEVVTPNVFSSGGAKWNLMAAYGAQLNQGKSPEEALAFLKTLLEHAVVQPGSASDALTTFTSGKGDVLLAYESDAIEAQKAGEDIDYVVPDDTILIETPAATTTDASTQAQDFLDYLWTPEAQQLWADGGYRPVDQSVLAKNKDKFPTPPGLFDIASLGGWEKVNAEFFDPENGSVAKIEERPGGLHRVTLALKAPGGGYGVTPVAPGARAEAPPRPVAWPRLGGAALGRGLVTAYLSLIVLIPIAALVAKSTEGGLGGFWDSGDLSAGAFGPEADPDLLGDRGRDQRGRRHGDRLGPGQGQLPGQGDRQLGHRPSLRPADGRRGDHPARPLRDRQPGGDRHRLHAGRRRGGPAVRHPAVRRPRRAAGAARARPGDGGGRGVAGRRAR